MKTTPDIVRLLLDPDRDADAARIFQSAGFADPPKAAALWRRLRAAADPAADRVAILFDDIAASPDPDMAFLNVARLADAAIDPSALLASPLFGRPLCPMLVRLFSSSYWLADIAIRNPGYLWWLIERRTIERKTEANAIRRELAAQLRPFRDERRRINSLKRIQRREILRIGTRDLLGLAGVETVARELGILADAVIEAALLIAGGEAAAEAAGGGRPGAESGADATQPDPPPEGFAVVSLGKLGGLELNYSSDIDLLYVYDANLVDRGRATDLARRLTAILAEKTEEGILYRVDLRLRPDGESGPVAVSTGEHLGYLQGRARFWERQALLKARVSAGDRETGAAFLGNCERVVFNPLAEPVPLGDILAMRERGLRLLSPERRTDDIKRMPGGIRDIEFLVQALQLVYGRHRPDVRGTNTLDALARLEEHGLLAPGVHDTLADAYRLFRTVEHRLQLFRGSRTHRLPAGGEELARLGGRVAYSGLARLPAPAGFSAALGSSIERVRGIFEGFFPAGAGEEIPLLLSLPPGEEAALLLLSRYGIAEGESARRFIDSLVYGDFPRLEGPGTLAAAVRHLPAVLEAVGATPDPSLTLRNLVRIVKATGAVRTTLELLGRGGDLLRLFLAVAALSTDLSDLLANRIELLDRLAAGAGPPPAPSGGDAGTVARWRAESTLFLHCKAPPPGAGRRRIAPRLTAIVEAALGALFGEAGGDEAGIALFALGSLGACDVRAGSDLDIVPVIGDGGDPQAGVVAVRQLIDLASRAGVGQVDARLRGEGGGAPLVQTIGRYRRYFAGRASLWELVAFTRCRFVCGRAATGAAFATALPGMLDIDRFRPGLADRFRGERRRLESLAAGPRDVKHAPGGLYDIHFIAAGARLLVDPASAPGTVDAALGRLVDAGLLEAAERTILVDALDRFWLVQHAAALHGIPYPPLAGREAFMDGYLERFAGTGGTAFVRWLDGARADVRAVFERYLSRVT
ncbi:MAG: hypothetical protein JW876_01165 [Candidatus Krumholzibacteriota bacterium]|nr:hypothetical protein [Candidatus Krumholzibacteriota bacterium]